MGWIKSKQCPLCEKQYFSYWGMAEHMIQKHCVEIPQENSTLPYIPPTFVCSCNTRFSTWGIYHLMEHLKQHRIRTREDWQRHAVEDTLLRGVS